MSDKSSSVSAANFSQEAVGSESGPSRRCSTAASAGAKISVIYVDDTSDVGDGRPDVVGSSASLMGDESVYKYNFNDPGVAERIFNDELHALVVENAVFKRENVLVAVVGSASRSEQIMVGTPDDCGLLPLGLTAVLEQLEATATPEEAGLAFASFVGSRGGLLFDLLSDAVSNIGAPPTLNPRISSSPSRSGVYVANPLRKGHPVPESSTPTAAFPYATAVRGCRKQMCHTVEDALEVLDLGRESELELILDSQHTAGPQGGPQRGRGSEGRAPSQQGLLSEG